MAEAVEELYVRSVSGEHSIDARQPIFLEDEWSIYYDQGFGRGSTEEEYTAGLKKIGSFKSIQLFWRYWNNLPLSRLPNGSNVRFFKGDIKPMWDHPGNENGGKWVLRPEDPGAVFLEIALALLGRHMRHAEDVCGLVYSVRAKGTSVNVWNRQARDKEQVESIGDDIREICNLSAQSQLQYMDHLGTMHFNDQVLKRGKEGKATRHDGDASGTKHRCVLQEHNQTNASLVLPIPLEGDKQVKENDSCSSKPQPPPPAYAPPPENGAVTHSESTEIRAKKIKDAPTNDIDKGTKLPTVAALFIGIVVSWMIFVCFLGGPGEGAINLEDHDSDL